MAVTPTYPGVYIEEIPSGVRTITGVATSVTAFVGLFTRGPMNVALQLFSFADFEREFGGLRRDSEASYGIRQFFLNGGAEAWVVRVGSLPAAGPAILVDATASVVLMDSPTGGTDVLRVTAGRRIRAASVLDPGEWANMLRIEVDYETDPAGRFNFTVQEMVIRNGRQQVVRTETYRNLTMTEGETKNAIEVVNEESKLVQLSRDDAWPLSRPAQTGTVGDTLAAVPGLISGDQFNITYNDPAGAVTRLVTINFTDAPNTLDGLRTLAQAAIQAAGRDNNDLIVAGATVELTGDDRLRVLLGRTSSDLDLGTPVTFTEEAGGGTASALGLVGAGVSENAQRYSAGAGAVGAQSSANPGVDLIPPDGDALRGVKEPNKTGLYALEDVDIFNILCIPRAAELPAAEMSDVISAAEAYCEERRAFLIVDIPASEDTLQEVRDWLSQNANLRHRNAALYFPQLRIPDPLNEYRLKNVGPSGTIAGLCARTDASRGIWKAPAGTEAVLRGVRELAHPLTDQENGSLNPLAINCLRTFDIYGNVCWGARTLDGSDQQASEWKYIPIRRLALYIEESLFRGTQFVTFEPNDEELWSVIRANVGAFMHRLFRQGAFQGTSPGEAYFVKCDAETTTPTDQNLGIVNILVGFAPLKPAEFVMIKIQQIAQQPQT